MFEHSLPLALCVCGCVHACGCVGMWVCGFVGVDEGVQRQLEAAMIVFRFSVCRKSLSVCLRLCETLVACLRAHVLDVVCVTQFRSSASIGLAPSPYPTLSIKPHARIHTLSPTRTHTLSHTQPLTISSSLCLYLHLSVTRARAHKYRRNGRPTARTPSPAQVPCEHVRKTAQHQVALACARALTVEVLCDRTSETTPPHSLLNSGSPPPHN